MDQKLDIIIDGVDMMKGKAQNIGNVNKLFIIRKLIIPRNKFLP